MKVNTVLGMTDHKMFALWTGECEKAQFAG